jgi:hypothetical protein
MAVRNSDPRKLVAVTDRVVKALSSLNPDDRVRVLTSVVSLMEISYVVPSGAASLGASSVVGANPQVRDAIPPPSQPTSGRRVSLTELYKEKGPATHPQRLAVFAYFRHKHEGKQTFARADLKGYYAKVQATPPGSNFDREFKNAVKLAYFYEDGANSYLTDTGTMAVEAGFGGKREKRADAGKKRKPKKKQKT